MSFSSFGSKIYCILHFHTCTIVYFPLIGVHLILFISVILYYSYTSYTFVCSYSIYLILCAFVYFLYFFLCLYTCFHLKLYCISCSCNCLYFHRIARLCFSYHIILYTFHINFLCVYFSFFFYIHVCKYLRSGFRK